jgi:hypothetical protein
LNEDKRRDNNVLYRGDGEGPKYSEASSFQNALRTSPADVSLSPDIVVAESLAEAWITAKITALYDMQIVLVSFKVAKLDVTTSGRAWTGRESVTPYPDSAYYPTGIAADANPDRGFSNQPGFNGTAQGPTMRASLIHSETIPGNQVHRLRRRH